MAIPMLKIRRPLGRLIFNMAIAIPGKTVFLIEAAPRLSKQLYKYWWCIEFLQGMVDFDANWVKFSWGQHNNKIWFDHEDEMP